ncbi:hypothetical protein [Paenibacillus sp. H1-7]|uniref:hypothetical protein n=1 Tax=Paenibacillus sp. H1-7 TaxID=2282849 RepID=UPI001EF99F5F|nr:hypothetical protein [Paenibacillus sp. H1-7]
MDTDFVCQYYWPHDSVKDEGGDRKKRERPPRSWLSKLFKRNARPSLRRVK